MYLKAIQKGNAGAMSNLGNVYFAQKKYDKAEDMYLKATENGIDDAMYNLGNVYREQKKYDKAKETYLNINLMIYSYFANPTTVILILY